MPLNEHEVADRLKKNYFEGGTPENKSAFYKAIGDFKELLQTGTDRATISRGIDLARQQIRREDYLSFE